MGIKTTELWLQLENALSHTDNLFLIAEEAEVGQHPKWVLDQSGQRSF